MIVLGVTAVMTMAMEKMKQWTGQQQQIGRQPQRVRPMFAQDKECGDNREGNAKQQPASLDGHVLTVLRRNALVMTLTELAAMAAAAIIGERRTPNRG